MRLHTLRQDGALWRAWGETDVLELSCPAQGVVRLRLAAGARTAYMTFPRLPAKHSLMLAPPAAALPSSDRPSLNRQSPNFLSPTLPSPSRPSLNRQSLDREPEVPALVQTESAAGEWRLIGGGLSVCVSQTGGRVTVHEQLDDTAANGAQGRLLAELGDWDASSDPLRRRRASLAAPAGHSYLGFGQKVGPLDKRGMHLTFWNTDCFPHHLDTDPMHLSVPFTTILTPQGQAHGLFLDETWRTEIDVAKRDPERLELVSAGQELDLYVLQGPTPAGVLRRYADLTGYAPLPPLWSLGAGQSRWGYKSQGEILSVIAGYREHNLPLDSVYLDIDYMDAYKVWTWDNLRYPDPAGLVKEARAAGVRLLPIVDPGVKAEPGYDVYESGVAGDHLVRTARGDVLLGEVWPDPAAFPDFTRKEVQNWWAELHKRFTDLGIAGQWNDMNEPANFSLRGPASALGVTGFTVGAQYTEGKTLPYDARHGNRTHLEMHNVYANGMAEASRAGYAKHAPKIRPFILTRAGAAGIQRSAVVWTGDNASRWSHLQLSLPMLMGLGLSGIPFSAPDVGGFDLDSTGELLARWYQAGLGYAFLRNHASNFTAYQEPWRFGEPYLSVIRGALQMRYRLMPHLYTLAAQATTSALPPLRPLALHYPGDAQARTETSSYLLGEGLLVAPVLHANTAQRSVYLPGSGLPGSGLPGAEEAWAELFDLASFGEVYAGGQTVTAAAPLSSLPLYLKRGQAIATTDTRAAHTTHARWEQLSWLAHAGPEGLTGSLYEDDGDGFGPHRLTRLWAERTGQRLVLGREEQGDLPRTARSEQLHLLGLDSVTEVQGARNWRFEDGLLRLTLPEGWTEISVVGD
ncbi:glycoside hydrolase family 31 protein [Deinococcus altitudinis]|uniref:glycoside hydrolase family 31 protein n=1 Tax=Deinococcus altitudinis TaxID=468914 RepID=UPI003892BCAB